jgi:hypothetical protein
VSFYAIAEKPRCFRFNNFYNFVCQVAGYAPKVFLGLAHSAASIIAASTGRAMMIFPAHRSTCCAQMSRASRFSVY